MPAIGGSLLVAGETTVDLYPVRGAVEPGSAIEWYVGGTGANVAVGAALLGADVSLLTTVGSDMFGRAAEQYLADSPVSISLTTRVEQNSPLTAFVPERDGGSGWDAWIDGSCFGFSLPERGPAVLDRFEWLQMGGTTLPESVNRREIDSLLETVSHSDTGLSFDLNGRPNQWADSASYREHVESVLPHCDLLFASDEDLSLAGLSAATDQLVAELPGDLSARVFVTRGNEATTALEVVDGELESHVEADPPRVSAVDSAGAGDAFVAAVLSALSAGESRLERLVTIGNAAGAAAVTTAGPFRHEDVATYRELVDEPP